MKFRPQVQLRFRDEAQFAEVRARADRQRLSLNEWLLRAVEVSYEGVVNGNSGVDVDDAGAKVGGGRDKAALPVLRKAKGAKKQLHPLQSVRDELGGGAGHIPASAHEGHDTYKAGDGRYCSTCEVRYV